MPLRKTTALHLFAAAVTGFSVQGASYEVLEEFIQPGAQPLAALVDGGDGNLYGTTVDGGAFGQGTIFSITPTGDLTTIHSFSGPDGRAPASALIRASDGFLYGTASSGGAQDFGLIFRISTTGAFASLHSLTGASGVAKGSVPGTLVQHANGNFYGVTQAGGAAGFGTVFCLTSAGIFTTLLEFTGTGGLTKGAEPVGALTFNGTTLFGVTKSGGASDKGVIYKVTTSGAYTLMTEFTGVSGTRLGSAPAAGLFLNPTDSTLYGTTEFGGTNDLGAAFKITTTASPTFTSLRSFADATGSQPVGTLARGSDGALYGVAAGGGTNGFGALYRITTAGTYSVLANFSGSSGAAIGAVGRAGMLLASDGNLWGTTSAGGLGTRGNIYKISEAGTFLSVALFENPLGWTPVGPPLADSGGWLVPMRSGGPNGQGSLARKQVGSAATLAGAFDTSNGAEPVGGLTRVGGDVFGVTTSGGSSNRGSTFRYNSTTGVTLVANHTTPGGVLAEGQLVRGEDGALYGTAREGGATSRGSLWKVTLAGTRNRLISFAGTAGSAKGERPRGSLALAPNTSFYGVTQSGGVANAGTIFRLSALGTLITLAEFTASGPRAPLGGLLLGTDGKIYGTTSLGGTNDAGTLIRIDPSTDSWSVLASFSTSVGETPAGGLAEGPDGALYGMTTAGGAEGYGSVFRYAAASGLSVLISFTGSAGSAPGLPSSGLGNDAPLGGLAFDQDGSLLGTAPAGGTWGGGVIFRIPDAVPPYFRWKWSQLGSITAGDDADADSDGFPNIIEYAQGTDPTNAASHGILKATPDGGNICVWFPRDSAAADVTLAVQESTTLASNSWAIVPNPPTVIETNGSIHTMCLQMPVSGVPRKFFRLMASPTP